jgi:hypothetical protein
MNFLKTKKQIMKKVFILFGLALVVLVSCKKSNNDCNLSSASILGNYKITSMFETSNGQTIDVFNDSTYTEPCSKDDIFTFNSNGVFTQSEGAVSCSPSNTFSANWSLNSNLLTLTDTTGGTSTSEVYTVSDFSCSSFKLTMVDSVNSYSTVISFSKQ